MAIKTFASGEILTASDTNTYLANAGLVYVTSTTVGSAVSSVTVSNCFSSTYDNYVIQYSGIVASANNSMTLKLGSTATGYYWGLIWVALGSATVNGAQAQNGASFTYAGVASTTGSSGTIELWGPNKAARTGMRSSYIEFLTNGAQGQSTGFLDDTTAYTAFTLTPGSGTYTGGTITVYGYRKA